MNVRILVVEDDQSTCLALADWLEHGGYRVTQAYNGTSAVDILQKTRFEIVVSDIILGDMNGLEILRQARNQKYPPEVILLTGQASLESSIEALRQGAFDYLQKPANPEILLDCVSRAVERHSSEQKLREAAQTMLRAINSRSGVAGTEQSSGGLEDQGHSPQVYNAELEVITIGELAIGKTRHEVTYQGHPLHVTPTEYSLLRYLAERAGEICFCYDIVQYTHGYRTTEADAQTMLRSHVRNLRKKIDGRYLVNDRGIGYKLVDPAANHIKN
jgi:DNA-binding response OmpR family regulator